MPAAGNYKLYWRNPETRSFEAVPGLHLLGSIGHIVVLASEDQQEHWYTKVGHGSWVPRRGYEYVKVKN